MHTLQIQLKTVVVEYFQPLRYLFDYLISKNQISTSKKVAIQKEETYRLATDVLTRAVCLNQGKYLQFAFLAAERHRVLKDHITSKVPNKIAIASSARQLVEFMNKSFYEATQENFALLHSHFSKRAASRPRVCIKGNFKIGNSDRIVTVFRDGPVSYSSSSEVDQNSGFAFIQKTGKYFLENDVLLAASADRYFNPRLDNNAAKILSKKKVVAGAEWIAAWRGAKNEADTYRSTLIIPMTLWNNQISDEFRKAVRIGNIGRTIFGYLCIDHADAGYFNENVDSRIGYAIADLLSMYLFSRMIYIEVSKTYERAQEIVKSGGLENEFERLEDGALRKMEAVLMSLNREFDVKESTKNTLLSIDKDLLKFVNIDPSFFTRDNVKTKVEKPGDQANSVF